MAFTSAEFHQVVGTDLWVLKQILTLPSDPEPTVTKTGDTIHIKIMETAGMGQMKQAVDQYRRKLISAIFVMAQKVYAELFRRVLDGAGQSAGNSQNDVETKLQPLFAANSITNSQPFSSMTELKDWWSGKYDYTKLRKGRNRVVHDKYTLASGILTVKDTDDVTVLINWSEDDILTFAQKTYDIGINV